MIEKEFMNLASALPGLDDDYYYVIYYMIYCLYLI